MQMAATSMKQWVVHQGEEANELQLEEASIPEIGDFDVLIKFHAASLNYRDLQILNVCTPFA